MSPGGVGVLYLHRKKYLVVWMANEQGVINLSIYERFALFSITFFTQPIVRTLKLIQILKTNTPEYTENIFFFEKYVFCVFEYTRKCRPGADVFQFAQNICVWIY